MSAMSLSETKENTSHTSLWQRQLAAILEVCGIYMAGLLIAFVVISVLGIKLANPLEILVANPNADLLGLSRDMALLLLVQYGGILIPAFLVGWWHRRRPLRDYGCTAAGHSASYLMLAGIVLFALSELPAKLLELMGQFVPLGPRADFQEILYALNWDYRFWIFAAVGSFVLIPIVEELFFRGYVQTRLAEDYGTPAAILITAFFFTFSHSQYYLAPSPRNIGMALTILFSAIVWGYAFYVTRSLIVPMIAHAIVNIPVAGVTDFILPVLMLVVVVVYRRRIGEHLQELWGMLKPVLAKRATILAVIFMALFAVAVAIAQDTTVLLGVAMLIIAGVLEAIEKRKLQHLQLATS